MLIAALGICLVKNAAAEEIVNVPEKVQEISEGLGERYGICPELIQAICWRESRFQADVRNGSCIGIMQVSKRWHTDRMQRLGVVDLYSMEGNMTVATDYLAELFSRYKEATTVLMVYHGEKNAVEKSARGEVSNYAADILELSAELERRHGK